MAGNKENLGLVDCMKSVFEAPVAAANPKSESGVSSLASRFESPDFSVKSSDEGSISSKISSIASTFEPVATGKAVTKPSMFMPRTSSKKKDTENNPEEKPSVVTTALPAVSEVAAIFASGNAGGANGRAAADVEPSAFQKATTAFQQREKDSSLPAVTKVSSFAEQFDRASKLGQPVHRRPSCEVSPSLPAVEQNAETLPDRFKKAISVFDGSHETDEEGFSGETASNRFKEASKIFGGSVN